jgi:RecA-family ATPase
VFDYLASAHAVSEVLAMVIGRPLLDSDGSLKAPLRVWYINAEDPQDEIDRRLHAVAKQTAGGAIVRRQRAV